MRNPHTMKTMNLFLRKRAAAALGALLALLVSRGAFAAGTEAGPAPTDLMQRATLFGDFGGIRPWLADHGVDLGLQESSEYFRNFTGGTRRGGEYGGTTQLTIGVDTRKAFGLPGGTFNVSGLQIHGRSLSMHDLGLMQNAGGLEADAGTRLWELWYKQSLFDDAFDVKIGQQSLDQEFMVSDTGAVFVNAAFGWPGLPSVDMPAGGPAYPLSSLGVRFRLAPSPHWTFLAGAFDDNPAGPGDGDPQRLNAHGTTFNLHGGTLLIGEAQYALNPDDAAGKAPAGLPGTYKVGFWYDTGRFDDLRDGADGVPLSDPTSGGTARPHHGNYGLYAIADQTVWRETGGPRALSVFAEVMGAPDDRNLVGIGVNAGLALKAPFAGRDDDVAGIAVGYSQIGSHARALDRDTAATTLGYPRRSAETVVEATYQYQAAPWWQLQGDLQYVFRPSGGIPDPLDPGRRIGNEVIAGVKTVLQF
ncbi:carbohydrate porin [Burkholderia plantarii]|uniref:carbohydrate porin n=1 Tax=Burkholderia plantarii TaxID=41899 RepID=UPI001F5BCF96|nr:carbohydrate porin [Burkholderia plantarii]